MKPFGSGYFGEWVTDENGLPAYRYDCDQLKDPAAISPTNTVWRKENDHTFQFGNNRIVCVASNFGTVQVRQDEGSPKFLGDIDPEKNCYGGGLGWLTDGDAVLSTYYDGKADSFERIFGAGYMRKIVKKGGLKADQLIFTPYGDDPVLISRVTIENNSAEPKELKWFEYWGARIYPMSLRTLVLSLATATSAFESYINNSAQPMRRKLADRYRNDFSADWNVLRNRTKFAGFTFASKQIWRIAQKRYRPLVEKAKNYSLYLGDLDEFEDVNPPETFLIAAATATEYPAGTPAVPSKDPPAEAFITDADAFFGQGGVSCPDGLRNTVKPKRKPSHTAMIAVSPVTVPAGGKVTLTYIYGYLPGGFEYPALKEKYCSDFDAFTTLFTDSCEMWKKDRISLDIPGQEWIDRELLWHNQSLRGAATYDSAFGEHILSQGHVYQYIMGFQGASRDPLQHVMPFIFTDPGLVREIIRYTAKTILPDGTVPYGICGNGTIMPSPTVSGDLEIWLIWTLSEYMLATKDVSILSERVVPYPYKGVKQEEDSILNLVERAYKHFLSYTGMGEHGLPGILEGDWNDNVVVGNTDPAEKARIREEGESVLTGAFSAAVLDKYAQALAMAGLENSHAADYARKQKEVVSQQWLKQGWFRRAYLGSNLGWVDKFWLEPQPWALMCGAADAEQAKTLVAGIREKCQDPSPIGAMLTDSCEAEGMKAPPGMASNGGIWPSITGTLIMALNKIDPAAAYEEWRKNTLAYHAENYPNSWEGTWSGPDTYNSILSDAPGRTFLVSNPEHRNSILTWMDFPVYNLHPHAWTLYNAASLFADAFTADGAVFNMGFPEKEYKFDSPLAALERTAESFSGKYNPAVSGKWKIELKFFEPEMEFKLLVNGEPASYERTENGIAFTGAGGAGTPLSWEISRA